MATAEATVVPLAGHRRWLPFGDPSRKRRLLKVVAWLAGIAAVIVVLQLLGVDVAGWFAQHVGRADGDRRRLPARGLGAADRADDADRVRLVLDPARRLPGRRASRTGRSSPPTRRAWRSTASCPANIGTFVMLLMFVAIIPGADFPGVLGGMVVQKIFFRSPARSSTSTCSLRWRARSSGSSSCCTTTRCSRWLIAAGVVFLLVVLVPDLLAQAARGSEAKAKQGGAILAPPARLPARVALPSLGAWLAKLGVIAVFLAGYGIAVTFHTVMSVVGGNSIANTVSVTPGGVGVNQATNVAALRDVTDAATATAYSLGQQLAITRGTSSSRSCSSCGRSAGRAARSSSSSPTRTRRSRSPSRRPAAARSATPSGRRAGRASRACAVRARRTSGGTTHLTGRGAAAAVRHDDAGLPPGRAPVAGRLEILRRQPGGGDDPGDHRVRVPHLPGVHLVAAPHRAGCLRGELDQSPCDVRVGRQAHRATNRDSRGRGSPRRASSAPRSGTGAGARARGCRPGRSRRRRGGPRRRPGTGRARWRSARRRARRRGRRDRGRAAGGAAPRRPGIRRPGR